METYTQEQVEQIKKDAINDKMLQFAKQIENTISNNYITSQKKNLFSNKFTTENVQMYLENPQKYEKELRQLSLVLNTLSPQYQQICNYLPSISKFVPIVVPNLDKFSNSKGEISDGEKIKKDYLKIISHIEKLHIPHEFQRITSVCVRDDIFYGYIYESNESFYIQQLDSDYCRISTISDGCFNYAFDFSYFDKNKTIKDVEGTLIENYPDEFKKKYNLYLSDKTRYKWQEIDEENSICIKMLEDFPFCFPAFASLFNDLSDLATYKELNKTKNETENYKFIGMQLPINQKSDKEDDFLVSTATAMAFYQMLLNNLPKGIGAFLSATPFESVNFGNSAVASKDEVNRAEDGLFTSSGISPINFGKNATSAGAVKYSNTVDESRLFKLYRQFERWLNRKFKREYSNKFYITLLDVTTFSIKDNIDNYLKLAQYGVPCKLQLSALAGINQSCERGLTFLEDNILNLSEEWKPLQSTHTQGGENAKDITDKGGRTRKEGTELKESGEASREIE